MRRVLVIAYSGYVRDARIKRHAEALAGRGDHVDVICLSDRQLQSANGVTAIPIELPRYRGSSRVAYLRSYSRFFLSASATAVRLSRSRPYDVVVVCSMPNVIVLCAMPLRVFGSRTVLDIHDPMPEVYSDRFKDGNAVIGAKLLYLEERASARLADHVLVTHDLYRERLKAAGIPPDKVTVVVNSPDPKIFSYAPLNRPPHRGIRLVCPGAITRRLGLDLALRAMALLRTRVDFPVDLTVIGRGDDLERLKALATSLGVQDSVYFRDAVPVEQLPQLLRESDVGLVCNWPTAATHLMLPAKLLEYAALGIPIITPRLRTIENYFPDQAVCYFEPGKAESLADAIEALGADPSRCAELSTRVREVIAPLSWPVQRDKLFAALDSILR